MRVSPPSYHSVAKCRNKRQRLATCFSPRDGRRFKKTALQESRISPFSLDEIRSTRYFSLAVGRFEPRREPILSKARGSSNGNRFPPSLHVIVEDARSTLVN